MEDPLAAIARPHEGLKVFEGPWLQVSAGGGVLILAGLVGAGYVVGAIVTQLTFDAFVQGMRHGVRERHADTLAQLAQALDRPGDNALLRHAALGPVTPLDGAATAPAADRDSGTIRPNAPSRIRSAFRRAWRLYWGVGKPPAPLTTTQVARDLVSQAARALATDETMRELEYRRSNRQVFLGAMPAVVVSTVAACLTFIGSGLQATIVTVLLAPGLGIGGTRHLLAAARFQEQYIVTLDQNVLSMHDLGVLPQEKRPQ